MKHHFPILVVFLLVFTGASLTSGTLDKDWHQHRVSFLSEHPTVARDTEVQLHWNGEIHELPLDAVADHYADRMVALARQDAPPAEEHRPGDGAPKGGDARASEDVLHAGSFLLIETHRYRGTNPTNACSHPGSHHVVGAENPTTNQPIIYEYTGAAQSDVAAYGDGEIYDVIDQQHIASYRSEVVYAGTSDFFCVVTPTPDGGIVFNNPYVTGVVKTVG